MIDYLSLKRITDLHAAEITAAVNRVVGSGWYLQGQETQQFEAEYAQYIGTKHCITCGNGLDALSLILRAYMELGCLKEGDEVIVPANTYIATILSITENRLVPVLVEPDINTLELDERLIEQAITPKTRAIMLVHLYGRCAYTPLITELCQHKSSCFLKIMHRHMAVIIRRNALEVLAMQLPTASIRVRISVHWVMLEQSQQMMKRWQRP